MTYVVTEALHQVQVHGLRRGSAPSTVSTRARTCWSSIRTNASTAASCEPECPPEAIVPDTDPQAETWLETEPRIQRQQVAQHYPQGRPPRPTPTTIRDQEGKYEKFFSANPGNTDG